MDNSSTVKLNKEIIRLEEKKQVKAMNDNIGQLHNNISVISSSNLADIKTYPLDNKLYCTIKLIIDKVGAFCALLLLSPLIAYIAIKVRKDGGPAFYSQIRLGKNGKEFKCWKIRSMVNNADEVLKKLLENNPEARKEWETDFKLRNDPRITKLGRFIRKTSLDELPQFYNVIIGDMSLVGPRPIVNAERKYYGHNIKSYLSVRPGMTGIWQVSGRNDTGYSKRVKLDSEYVKDWTLWQDIKILFKTVTVIFNKDGAY